MRFGRLVAARWRAAGGLSEIRFVKAGDVASRELARLCVAATPLARARFEFVRPGPDGAWIKHYGIELEQVTVANVATGTQRASAAMETVVLAFAQVRLTSGGQGGEGD
ncbi:type VI secretion system tube protein Hcp [Pseudoduganella lutea]|uniref:type VI secretion system tube protein Hcp n=1 Tax=Pseudoduganella lutea TaxID=321985 RepID=UPI0013EE7977|nr:type VI secretion system tube protein Hcp [Pseudoduganella lutea]